MYPFLRMVKETWANRNAPPLGLTGTHVSHHICWPWDLDIWMELNNGRTLTLYDLGRIPMAIRAGLIAVLRREGWGITVAGVSVRLNRAIDPTGLNLFDAASVNLGASYIDAGEAAQAAPYFEGALRAVEQRAGGLMDHEVRVRAEDPHEPPALRVAQERRGGQFFALAQEGRKQQRHLGIGLRRVPGALHAKERAEGLEVAAAVPLLLVRRPFHILCIDREARSLERRHGIPEQGRALTGGGQCTGGGWPVH